MARFLVFAEVTPDGGVDSTALEILTRVRDLGDAEAVALGPGAKSAAERLGEYGAQIVWVNEDDAFADFLAQPAAEALHQLVEQGAPDVILFATNYDSRDIAGRLSAKTGTTLMSNAMDIVDENTAKTAIFGGSTIVDCSLEGALKLVLIRPKSFAAEPTGGDAVIEEFSADISDDAKKAKRVERHEEAASGPKLDQAPIVISGGRGLQEPANFELLDQLAAALGNAAVGATRAVVDAGWVPYSYQIGQTGITVKPGVYLAVGISGATQHVVGMKGAKKIIAINKDEEAPIFQLADLGIVGDALKILPQLIDEVKSRKG